MVPEKWPQRQKRVFSGKQPVQKQAAVVIQQARIRSPEQRCSFPAKKAGGNFFVQAFRKITQGSGYGRTGNVPAAEGIPHNGLILQPALLSAVAMQGGKALQSHPNYAHGQILPSSRLKHARFHAARSRSMNSRCAFWLALCISVLSSGAPGRGAAGQKSALRFADRSSFMMASR